jgi:hypothetical protein
LSRPRYSALAEASVAGILFPACLVAGYLLGKWTAGWLGLGSWVAFLGAALGVAAGFWNLYRIVRRMDPR